MPRNITTLGYRAAYDDQNTKLFEYNNFNLTNSSSMVLEGLRWVLDFDPAQVCPLLISLNNLVPPSDEPPDVCSTALDSAQMHPPAGI
jgi:hypothetical protein